MIRIVLADDEQLTRGAVAALLSMESDLQVVGQAATGSGALEAVRAHQPDIAVLDLDMPDGDGAQIAERIAAELSSTRCIILTRHARPGVLRRALAAGATGFVAKSVPAVTLAQVIRRVHAGGRYVDPELALAALDTEDNPLTARELDVLRHVSAETTATDIARATHLSPGTVRNYLSSAMQKLGVRTRLQAVEHARDQGWL